MGLLRDTFERLEEFGFIIQTSEVLNSLNVFYFRKDFISVVVKQYTVDVDSELIISEASHIREILITDSINIWNTYFLIVSNYKIDKELTYVIERDSRVFRKYLIRNMKDCNRIPFLDKIEVSNMETSLFPSFSMKSESTEILELLDFIKDNNGESGSIKQNIINNGIKSILGLGGTIKNGN